MDERPPASGWPGPQRLAPPASQPHPPALPGRDMPTFLFTDIEGSTRLWEEYPQVMPASLAQHDALLHATIARHGGAVVKGTGDGLIAIFDQATDALAAAVSAQHALLGAIWPVSGPIQVRMALHSGAAHLRDGDYFGPTLNRAARMLALGHGGQILLSQATLALLHDRLPPAIGLCDLGLQRLKDLTYPERVYQLLGPDLPSLFPPLRYPVEPPHNLPAPPNLLIGREAELAAIHALLQRADLRLLTLLGPGGTGKTRLALQVAREQLGRYFDGVWLVDLAPAHDPALVLPTIARTLGLREREAQPAAALLAAYLRERELLLLLDNCEQVIAAAPDLAALLAAAPRLRMLATTRAALHLTGEQIYAVPPLTVAAPGDAAPLRSPAVQLFVDRARAAGGDLPADGAAAALLATICRRLDGLPLAIELAAARTRLLSPQMILDRLGQPLDLLTGGARDLPLRQQTLRALIAWSYALLDADEQALFRRLGVFVDGWDLASATAVGGLGAATPTLLEALSDQSLVQPAESPGQPHADRPAGETSPQRRYAMLATIREYALEQLAAAGEEAATLERHAAYYLAFAERASPEEHGPQFSAWLGRLADEHANLQTALQTSFTAGADERAALLCAYLRWFWFYHGHFAVAATWVELAWARQHELAPPVRARFLRECAWLIPGYDRQIQAAETSLALYRTLGDAEGEAWALVVLGGIPYFMGDAERSRAPAVACLPLARRLGDDRLLVSALNNLGHIHMIDGEYTAAWRLFEEGLARSHALGNQMLVAIFSGCLGETALLQGAYPIAEAHYHEGAALRAALGDRRGMAAHLHGASEAILLQGDTARALHLEQQSLAVFAEIGWPQGVGWVHATLAWAAHELGQNERAARFLGAEAAIRQAAGYTVGPTMRAAYDRTVDNVCAALGAEAFQAAWTAGYALSLDMATREALAWLDEQLADRLGA